MTGPVSFGKELTRLQPVTTTVSLSWDGSAVSKPLPEHKRYRFHSLVVSASRTDAATLTGTITVRGRVPDGGYVNVGTFSLGTDNEHGPFFFRAFLTDIEVSGSGTNAQCSVSLTSSPTLTTEIQATTQVFKGWTGASGRKSGQITHDSLSRHQISATTTGSGSGTFDVYGQPPKQNFFIYLGQLQITSGVGEYLSAAGRYIAFALEVNSAMTAGSVDCVVTSYLDPEGFNSDELLGGDYTFEDNVTINGTLTVDGTSTFNSEISVFSSLGNLIERDFAADNNTERNVLTLRRIDSTDVGADGIGGRVAFQTENTVGANVNTGRLNWGLSTALDGGEVGFFSLDLISSGTDDVQAMILSGDTMASTWSGVTGTSTLHQWNGDLAIQHRLRSDTVTNRRIIGLGTDDVVDSQINFGATGLKMGLGTLSAGDALGILHVHQGAAGAATAGTSQDDVIVEGSEDTGFTIQTPDDHYATYGFGSVSKGYNGGMFIRYSDLEMSVGSAVSGMDLRLLCDNSRVGATLHSEGRLTLSEDTGQTSNLATFHSFSNGSVNNTMSRSQLCVNNATGQLNDWYRGRGTNASPVALQANDDIFQWRWYGRLDDNTWTQYGRMEYQVSQVGNTTFDGFLRIYNSHDGNLYEQARLSNSGLMDLGTKTTSDSFTLRFYNGAMSAGNQPNRFDITHDADSITVLRKYRETGNSRIDLDPVPEDGTSDAQVTLFRTTNNSVSGSSSLIWYRGNNSTTVDHQIFSGNSGTLMDMCRNGGDADFGGAINVTSNSIIGSTSVTPDGRLHLYQASAGTVTANGQANALVLEQNTAGGMTILTPNAAPGNIFWGSPSDQIHAAINAQQSNGQLNISTRATSGVLRFLSANNVLAMAIDSNQDVDMENSLVVGNSGANGGDLIRVPRNDLANRASGMSDGSVYFDTDMSHIRVSDGTYNKTLFPGSPLTNWQFRFSTNTADSDPGTGYFKVNNSNIGLSTFIYMNDRSWDGIDMSNNFHQLILSGDVIVMTMIEDNMQDLLRWDVSGNATTGTGYIKIPVTVSIRSFGPASLERCLLSWVPQ